MGMIEKDTMEINKETDRRLLQIMVVGADDLLLQMKDKLTSNRSDLRTIPILEMGISGKTTLALNIYQEALNLIEENFDVRVWVITISQEYIIRQTFIQLLVQLIKKNLIKNRGRVN